MADEYIFSDKYEGGIENARMHGEGVYTFPDGSKYEGEFRNGDFHGKGTLISTSGAKHVGIWKNGKADDVKYIFPDGLPFAAKDWQYCTKSDRRFWAEMQNGIKPAGNTQRGNEATKAHTPAGCFDVGEGFYDPTTHMVHPYNSTSDEKPRQPTDEEIKWIESKAPISSNRE
uniref:MORN repeat-containing protein 5 n=1 Tax=Octactis speculum TaxID=3111310 RepID=A0A7S2DWC0_9STRA|mmetsp:Transcript_5453/g.6776  ORF Transcript_5453/g.6776 Transcript_5453/m.6776 type:complete len:172 (+) Transcript_5453:125-640(+)